MAARKIFINYRRDDSRADAGRLYDRLHARYPDRIFRDVGSLEPGVEWHTAIERVLGSSDACIVVIGPHWLSIADANGKRRLDDPRDTVRKEVATALANGMRVFPVLVGGAKMPAEEDLPEELQSLARRNALEISEQDFDEDVEKLARALERTLGWTPKPTSSAKSSGPLIVVGGLAAVAIVGVVSYFIVQNARSAPQPGPVQPGLIQQPVSGGDQPKEPLKAPQSGGQRVVPAPEPPPPAPRRQTQIVGAWRAVVRTNGQEIDEDVEVYPDSSFRVMVNGNIVAAVGKWRRDNESGGFEVVSAVNFLNNNARFSCRYRVDDDALQGLCRDRLSNTWSVTLTDPRAVSEVETELPAVNLSGATMAERAAFIQLLSSEPCTCGCGLTMHTCLLKDRTCPLSPGLARTQWAAFLQLVRT
jgi:hypothetical protein